MKKQMTLTKQKNEIYEECLVCQYFVFDWTSRPFCALGYDIYGICFESSKWKRTDYD